MLEYDYYEENEDLKRHVEENIDWEEAVSAYEDDFADAKLFRETGDENLSMAPGDLEEALEYYRAIFQSMGEIAGKFIAPRVERAEREGLRMVDGVVEFPPDVLESFAALKEAGIPAYGISRHYGGLGLPFQAQMAYLEMLARAFPALSLTIGCLNIPEVLERYASEEICREWIPPAAAGEMICAMALTEPDYGSDLSNLRLRAEKDEKGEWKLSGVKRFITHGCGLTGLSSSLLTLARSGTPENGARGLSFFLVRGEDVKTASIEKKMGLHCSPTCEIVYENSPGILIGEEGQGLIRGAMSMMNAARLAIAAQSLGIAQSAFSEAARYAAEREQFGGPIAEIPAVKRMLRRMDEEMNAMRVLLGEAARTTDLYVWRRDRLRRTGMADRELNKDQTVRRWQRLANFFTPLVKYYIAERCNEIAYDAVQVFGGSGYVEDFSISRIYRDARITSIYEGTSQMQVHGAIGGITAGLNEGGLLKDYIENEMELYGPSPEIRALYESFAEFVQLYKTLEEGEAREELALDATETAARFLGSLLLERSIGRARGEDLRKRRETLRTGYATEARAVIAAARSRLDAALKK